MAPVGHPSASSSLYTLATKALTGDHAYAQGNEVAPNISVTTTFRHLPPSHAEPSADWNPRQPSTDVYSRYTQPTLTRAEKVMESIIGQPTLLYPSGIAATFAALVLVRPDVIAITAGYHGCHGSIEVYQKLRGAENVRIIALEDDYTLRGSEKQILCWLETPVNPNGLCRDIAYYSNKVHAIKGGKLAIDSTFAPPPLSDPFAFCQGVDMVMHAVTKYFAGHSDCLAGSLSVRSEEDWHQLWHNRTYTGSNIGSLDAWLVLRGCRTLTLRVNQQSDTATAIAYWLTSLTRAAPGSHLDGPEGFIAAVSHASLQDNGEWVGEGKQMVKGPACFSILTTKPFYAAWLGHCVEIFTPATSLGGVESLIEHRIVSDAGSDPCLVRLSIGVESFEDLKRDLIQGMYRVMEKEQGGSLKL